MKARFLLVVMLLCLILALSAFAQTSHDYFTELRAANAFNHYKDEYVCFRDDDVPTFMVVAKVSDVIEHLTKAGDAVAAKNMVQIKEGLFLQTYYKGISSEEYFYEPAKKGISDENREYSLEFNGKYPGKMVYAINWVTGRYLQRLYMYQKSKTTPAIEGSGKCELIHPVQPSVSSHPL